MPFLPRLSSFISELSGDFDRVDPDHLHSLKQVACYLRERVEQGQRADLTFICTHNSRRSHMAQVWAQAAAAWYKLPGVTAYSGGTEATAFFPGAVEALQRAGFQIEQTTGGANPIYHARFSEEAPPVTHFSKVYSDAPNPRESYCAVMTCSAADADCPIVSGADLRLPLTFGDPKDFDGTDRADQAYDERCRQIGRAILYAFSLAGRNRE